ncbi:hypothetical protein CTAYLR_000315 [Chrysophaeum taylorii]|uniref:Methyltransferase domain-containing protein n=1 Tax=Chrysophaeum taylorii TaxID=2483200 RepID=A0AAD7UGE5_9STRA|nr:hypothetical protein CTAYLR_000315 [Chrysophaeum taylorii]
MKTHYAAVATRYSSAMFYAEGPFKQWQVGCLIRALELARGHRLADVGGGSGVFAAAMARAVGGVSVTLVEPSAAMIESGGKEASISRKVCADGAAWAATAEDRHDRILLKEVVHHMSDRSACFRAMRTRKLTADGVLVVATRPRSAIDYPFFDAARRVWADNQPDEASLARELKDAGFCSVTTSIEAFPCEIRKQAWIEMVRSRFWSTFSHFTDAELERGIAEIDAAYPDERLAFEERLVVVVARATIRAPPAWPLAARLAADGFAGPERVLGRGEAVELLRILDEFGAPAEALRGNDRFKLHLLIPELADLVRRETLTTAARQILGTDDVLVWSTDLVCKAPGTPGHFTPHQDSAYAGLEPALACVTAWVALSDAPEAAGCLRFYPRSHLRGPLPHVRSSTEESSGNNMLAFGQRIAEYSDQQFASVPVPLRAGECSWHSMPTVHWSPPNATPDQRRVGLAIRYIAAAATRDGECRESATLAAGDYDPRCGAFDLEPRPETRAGPEERAAHADAMAREARNYFRHQGDTCTRGYEYH